MKVPPHANTPELDQAEAAHYTQEREKPSVYSFRLRSRANAAVGAIKRYGSQLPEQISLLDIGAADGLTLQWMARSLPLKSGVGVEYSQSLIDQSRQMPKPLELVQGDATDLSGRFPEARFDAVTAMAVLEHLPEPGLAVAEATRLLKPGGLFIASCPDPLWDRISSWMLGVKAHDHEVSFALFQKLVEQQPGLELVALRKFMFVPIAALPYVRIYPSASFAQKAEDWLVPLKVFNLLFANQLVVARKTGS